MITLDPEFIGQLAEPGHVPFATPELPFRQKPRLDRLRDLGKADESPASDGEEVDNASISDGDKQSGRAKAKEKMKMRGKGKSLKRHLRKKRKNVIDPSTVSAIFTSHSNTPDIAAFVHIDRAVANYMTRWLSARK
jgi:U3 small nucleolar RNA-associated protein 7